MILLISAFRAFLPVNENMRFVYKATNFWRERERQGGDRRREKGTMRERGTAQV